MALLLLLTHALILRAAVSAAAEEGDGGRGYGDRGGGGGRGRGDFSYDDSDPFTTNLYVGNIHPEVRMCVGVAGVCARGSLYVHVCACVCVC